MNKTKTVHKISFLKSCIIFAKTIMMMIILIKIEKHTFVALIYSIKTPHNTFRKIIP